MMLPDPKVIEFVTTALECSIYNSPTDPGLTYAELVECGARLGLQAGEIQDAIRFSQADQVGAKLLPRPNALIGYFLDREEPEYRDVKSFDFVRRELRDLARSVGGQGARLERSVLVERGAAHGLERTNVQAAITCMLLATQLVEDSGTVQLAPNQGQWPLASEQLVPQSHAPTQRPLKRRVNDAVRDVIARRTDGRPRHAEPLDAFAERLDQLGYAPFRMWWTQTLAELSKLDPILTPVSAAVTSAALVEGVLTFVVRHARSLKLGVFASKDFEREPRSWKIDDLVRSAAAGGPSAVLDEGTRHRADLLIKVRQRIHAGRMLCDFPQGVPDLRPEEARDAKATAELVVRKVLDWLDRFPVA